LAAHYFFISQRRMVIDVPRPKKRVFGEKFRPLATVLKEKDGVPTRVEFNGNEYFMINPAQDKKDHFNNSNARRAMNRKALQQKRRNEHGHSKTM
jgi:hypothetical protein